jgi:Ca2+-binding EF-hand superfamily protein
MGRSVRDGRKEYFSMRKVLFAAAGLAALAGVAGLALAQGNGDDQPRRARFDVFQADANNDGVLTRAEFDTGRDARFAEQDGDNDGQLTREEMRDGWGRGHHRGGRHGGPDRGMHHLMGADANNDGNVTRDEFLARPIEMFQRIDANSDGVITEAERPQREERADGERRERRGRPDFDANDDRQMSRSEYAAMSDGMFERMDANDDGRVTREEADAARSHRRERE